MSLALTPMKLLVSSLLLLVSALKVYAGEYSFSTANEDSTEILTISHGKKLVAKLYIDTKSKTIISLLPTPMQSDALRPIGEFVEVGDGWSETHEFIITNNRLCVWEPSSILLEGNKEYSLIHQRTPVSKDNLKHFSLKGKYVYLTVTQNTSV